MEAKTAPLVSVILPFHQSPTLSSAIESILKQSFSDLELILVDNQSDDSTRQVAATLAESDPRIKLIHEPRKGVVFAANRAIEEAAGDFIARMDADDYSFPNRIELQVDAFHADPDLGVVAGLVEYVGDSSNEGFITYVDWLNGICSSDEIRMSQFVEFPLANPSMMIKSRLFHQFGNYQEGAFPEDYEFFLRLMKGNVKMTKVQSPVLRWIDSETRLTRTDGRYSQESFFKVKSSYLASWLREHNAWHPEVYVWGAGRLSRRRSDYLKECGIKITGYIDVKSSKNVLFYKDIPAPGSCFIVSYVSNRGARKEIHEFLTAKGYMEGVHFILAA